MDECIRQIRWTGTTRGLVKNLPAFNKKRHNVPEAATPAAAAFLAKLLAPQIEAEAEAFFQKARAALNYKRADISLSLGESAALLAARDFSLEWSGALDPANPAEWTRTLALHSLRERAVLDSPQFDSLLDGAFTALEFTLSKPVRVEAVIDAVEALDAKGNTPALAVEYPSNCAHCTLRAKDAGAAAVFTGAELRMEFDRPGSPKELAEAFARIRHAFDLSGAATLSSLARGG